MSDLSARLNTALAGRYALRRELGRGGMAIVFLAEDEKHHRQVAIKVLVPELAAALGSELFLREIEFAARLTHPHILPLHDSGEADGLLYYVMPYVEGESLRQRLDREQQLPLEDALRITREVADALDYAHRRGVVHRDIKPENILLDGLHAVVADFGIARAMVAAGGVKLTTTGVVIGTPAYMSPEQISGSGVLDGRCDLYGLGCVLYEMLAGQPPFTGPTSASLAHQHLNVAARPVTEMRPTVPHEIERAIQRTLAKMAADRFSTASAFADALDHREPTAVVASAARVESAPPARRAWRLALLGGAAAVIAVVALLVPRPTPEPPTPTQPVHERSEIAVLPFQNLSGEGPHAYFAGGLHDELLTQLSKVAALKVISRTSVMGYQGTSIPPLKQIATELGVGSVVEGSVQVVGGRLRVNVQLIDAATDEHLWAERYDRTLDDAFAIQSEVAQAIAMAVGAALTSVEQGSLAAPPTANAEAYRFYLQGREYMNRPGLRRQDREAAQQLFERSLALDPSFALAHAWLSQAHGQIYFLRVDPSEARVARQREEAETALRLAPDLPEAHLAMGRVHYLGRRDYRRALGEYTIALKGLPNDAELWKWIGTAHRRLGNWNKVLEAFEKAKQLEPRSADLFHILGGNTYQRLRRYADAVHAYDRALSLAPDLHEVALLRAWTYVLWQGQLDTLRAALSRVPRDAEFGMLGSVAAQRAELLIWERNADGVLQMLETARGNEIGATDAALFAAWAQQLRGDHAAARVAFDSARERLDSAVEKHPQDWSVHAARGEALAGLGRRDEALREARWLQQSVVYREDAFDGPSLAAARAQILAQLGDAEAALDEIERLLARPAWLSVHTLRLDPRWDPIREHPRFKALLAKYGAVATGAG